MSRREPRIQPNPSAVSIFLQKAVEKHTQVIEDKPDAHPTFIAAVALDAQKHRVPLMRLREIANNRNNPPVWREVSKYIIDQCRV